MGKSLVEMASDDGDENYPCEMFKAIKYVS